MKTCRFHNFLTVPLGLAVVCWAGAPAAAQSPPAAPGASARSATGPPAAPGMLVVSASPRATAARAAAPASWEDIRDCTLDERAEFLAGLRRLDDRLNAQIGELHAMRALPDDVRSWEAALFEMTATRLELKAKAAEVDAAKADTWNELKAKTGQAWQRSQEAWQRAKDLNRT